MNIDENNVVMSVKNISKDFLLPHEQVNSIKSGVVNVFKKKKKTVEVQHALKDISFDIKKGEFFGILGRNGSGKSTLLKILSEIYQPTSGSVQSTGKVVPFIELGVGFNPELTGRENVYLNGALLGFGKEEIKKKYQTIVDFSELNDFMDQKLKNYSSGMQVRLAFSVAIQAEADILILDEVLAVGDTNFQQKCNDYFEKIKYESKTVILVTHNMDAVEKYCNRAMLINDGNILSIGNPSDVALKYSELNAQGGRDQKADPVDVVETEGVRIETSVNGNAKKTVLNAAEDSPVNLEVSFTSDEDLKNMSFGFTVFNGAGIPIFATNSKHVADKFTLSNGKKRTFTITLDNLFSNGTYDIAVALRKSERVIANSRKSDAFSVYGRKHEFAVTSPHFTLSSK